VASNQYVENYNKTSSGVTRGGPPRVTPSRGEVIPEWNIFCGWI